MTHYAHSLQSVSLLERLVLPDNFIEEDDGCTAECPGLQSRIAFLREFSMQQPWYHFEDIPAVQEPRHGRTGFIQSVWLMFRHIPFNDFQYSRLTEIVLRNNIQCDIYSHAHFQFNFLHNVGLSCPRLKVLDLFGTDTWADCLIAFFFRDAFHSLHRFLYFFSSGGENGEEEVYHPHNISR